VGFADSSFTTTRACPGGTTLFSATSGVLPIALRIPTAVVGFKAGTLALSQRRAKRSMPRWPMNQEPTHPVSHTMIAVRSAALKPPVM